MRTRCFSLLSVFTMVLGSLVLLSDAWAQGWVGDERLLRELKLSEEQEEQIDQLRYEFEKARIGAEAKLRLAELEFGRVAHNLEAPDEKIVGALEDLMRARFEMEKIGLLTSRESSRLLNAKQRQLLNKREMMMRKRHERMEREEERCRHEHKMKEQRPPEHTKAHKRDAEHGSKSKTHAEKEKKQERMKP